MPQPKLDATFLVLDSKLTVSQIPVTPSLCDELDTKFDRFKGCLLISQYSFSSDWSSWEMHPNGDETLYLVSGEATLHLYADGVEQQVEFNAPSSFVVIPKGAWHTAKVKASCTILFITPGEGTINCRDPRSQNA
jgi:mannose-6-phosphate isomerase-like protein (cupin superfamily)